MKKVLCVAVVAMMAVSVGFAEEAGSETGNIGVGYQGVVLGNLMNGVAVRMKPAPLGAQVELVQGSVDVDSGALEADLLVIKGKAYYALVERENSKMYVGASLGYWMAEIEGADIDGFSVAPLMGVEWNFAELPELGINFEVSYEIDMLEVDAGGGTADIDLSGITVSTGIVYYF